MIFFALCSIVFFEYYLFYIKMVAILLKCVILVV